MSTRSYLKISLAFFLCSIGVADSQVPENTEDPRVQRLQRFFETYNCPQPWHVAEYLKAADINGIDYRILPVVSLMESTCGRKQRLQNYWGWNSARSGFESVPAGIHFISARLAQSPYYKGRTIQEKLFAYNPDQAYVTLATKLLLAIETP